MYYARPQKEFGHSIADQESWQVLVLYQNDEICVNGKYVRNEKTTGKACNKRV